MGDRDRQDYVLRAETGYFRVVPGSSNIIANTAIIALESLSSPTQNSVIRSVPSKTSQQQSSMPPGTVQLRKRDAQGDASKDPNAIVLSRNFKLVFTAIVAITVLSGLAQIVMAAVWGTPSGLQQEVFSAMGFAWKAGFGAIVGLLGGKAT